MGKFNPNKPVVLGMEFTPIAGNLRSMDIGTEIGYGFTVTGAPHDAVASVLARPFISASSMTGQTLAYSIYPRGREDDTGDINVVRLTVSTAFVTGAVVSGSSAAACLQTASDNSYIEFDALADRLRVTFNAPFALTDKRILGVDLVYQAAGSAGFALEPSIESNTVIYPYGPYITGPPALTQAVSELGVVRFGEVNPWFSTSAGPNTSSDRGNWRYTDMLRWLTGAGGQLFIGVRPSTIPLGGSVRLGYLAVDVYYCEESRVAYGGTAYGQDPAGLLTFSALSASVAMRNALTQAAVTLTPGDYTITATLADAGDKFNAGDKILLPQVFQLDELSTHPTVQIEKFKRPVAGRPEIAPLSSSTDYMVAAVMNTGAQALQFGEAPVPYYTSEGAPIYRTSAGDNIDATQEIHNEGIPGVDYPWIRFYARRFNPLAAGNLTILPPGAGATEITPAEFVTYPEITLGENGPGTGWREITRRLDDPAAFTNDSTFSSVSFSMGGIGKSQAIDQYQILTSRVFTPVNISGKAPVSNTASSLYQKSRYDGLQNANLTWLPPEALVPTLVVDSNSTVVVMFSIDPPAVTGLEITQLSQPVSGIGLDCFGGVPRCIPTGITYNHLTWGDNLIVCDTFTREVTGGWGDADTGQTWTVSPTAGDFSVNGTQGLITLNSVNVNRYASIDGPLLDGRVSALVAPGEIALGAPIELGVIGRRDDGADTSYLADISFGISFTATGTATLRLRSEVAGVFTTLATYALSDYSVDSAYYIWLEMNGSELRAKAWRSDQPEALSWQLQATDSNITTAGKTGVFANLATGNTNGTVVAEFDDFMSTPLALTDDAYTEVQRMDEVDEEWQTIATLSVCAKEMDDYEARVGVESTYRIRAVSTSGFAGPWSSEVSTTLPAPGISGAGDGNSVLIFTSNQAPTGNLAYVMTWDGDVSEEFTFPEAGFGQVRTQYQRDFYTSFHGTERGGEAFSRDILVQAAAITPESLANFKSLRDLAWADLPYICLRDELGNRWFASVRVPTGIVRRNRRLYNARIDVVESTATPAPVTS